MHPDVLATFQDFLSHCDLPKENRPEILWQNFRNQYYIEEWDISYDDFMQFITQVFKKERCCKCGTNQFPYHIQGDRACTRCLVTTGGLHV
jgi:hypothetical protein